MNILFDKQFLKKLNKNYNINDEYVNISKELVKIKIEKQKFNKQSFDKTIRIIRNILLSINKNYLIILNKMLKEENENKPIIYIYNSNEEINESLTFKNQIHFYKEDNIKDVYILLHEFTHFILNSKHILLNNNKEILPILMEFIISNKLNDTTYIFDRLNDTIFNSKSLLIKNEIINNNFDLNDKIIEFNINDKELKMIEEDLLYNKNLDYNDEISYIKGFIYAYYYSNDINNYKRLINNFKLDNINTNEVINDIRQLNKVRSK